MSMNISSLRAGLAAVALLIAQGASVTAQTTYAGNGQTGFGGVIGNGSLTLTQSGSNLVFSFSTGAAFNDYLVFYIDTTAGGATSLPITNGNTAPSGVEAGPRRAVVNEFGSGISSFPSGFGADKAISLNSATARVYNLASSGNTPTSLGLAASSSLTGAGSASDPYSFTLSFSSLGITAGQSFTFVTTYLNPFSGTGNNATFRSNEQFGATDLGTSNPGFNDGGLATALTFQTVPVPEPSTWAAGVLAVGAVGFSQRRRLTRLAQRV